MASKEYYQKNKEKIKAKVKAYQEANRERRKKYMRDYCQKNSEKAVERATLWAAENPERSRELKSVWKKENPDAAVRHAHTRRARLAAGGAYTPEEWRDLCALYEHRCAKCRKDRKLSVDHIVPISKGGSNYIWNIQPLCIKCNIAKGSLHATYYPPPVYSY